MAQPLKLNPPVKLTDKGRAREMNEDWVDFRFPQDPQELGRKGTLLVVADGMGGHAGGQVAARVAVETAISQYYTDPSTDVRRSLVNAVKAANAEVYALLPRRDETVVGTTLTAAVVRGPELYIAHVGDSRAYRIRDGKITQLTRDHTLVDSLVRRRLLTPQQARTHPERGVLLRAVGTSPDVEVDLHQHTLRQGDTLILCSDGLTGQMEDEEIRKIAVENPPERAAQQMVDRVNSRGGNDNISVVILQAPGRPTAVPTRPVLPPKLVRYLGLALVLLVIGVAGALVAQKVFSELTSASTPTPATVVVNTASPTPILGSTVTEIAASPTAVPTQATATAGITAPTAPPPQPTSTLRPTPTATNTSPPQPTRTPTQTAAITPTETQQGPDQPPVVTPTNTPPTPEATPSPTPITPTPTPITPTPCIIGSPGCG